MRRAPKRTTVAQVFLKGEHAVDRALGQSGRTALLCEKQGFICQRMLRFLMYTERECVCVCE